MSNVIDAMMHDRISRQPTIEDIQEALRTFFQKQLNKSLELSYDLPDDKDVDLDAEIEGLGEPEEARPDLDRRRDSIRRHRFDKCVGPQPVRS